MTDNGNGNGYNNNNHNNNNHAPFDGNANGEFRRRMERGLLDQEREFQRTRDDVNVLKQQQSVIQRDIAALGTGIKALSVKFDDTSKTNWPAIGLAVAMFGFAVPGLGFVMTSYTASALAPVANQVNINAENIRHNEQALRAVETATAASQSADVASRADRTQLNERMRSIEAVVAAEVGDRRAGSAAAKVALAEIESQFHALSNIENLRAAQQERLNSLLWEKSHPGDRYPNGTFFPTTMFGGVGANTTNQ